MPKHIDDKEIGDSHLIFYKNESFDNRPLYSFFLGDRFVELNFFPIEFESERMARGFYNMIRTPEEFDLECKKVEQTLEDRFRFYACLYDGY